MQAAVETALAAAGWPMSEGDALQLSALAMAASGAAAFVALSFVEAPYGKYASKAGWYYGCMLPGRLAWALQEAPSFLVPAYAWWEAAHASPGAPPARLASLTPHTALLGMYLLHYFNRAFVFPLRLRGGKPTPLVVFLMALCFCGWNGWMQGRHLVGGYAAYPDGYLSSPRFLAGLALFVTGMAVNWHSDGVLIGLRRPGETGYKIPRGGAFELVSGANFFGEILEWSGWALAAGTRPALAFAFFTFCNIGPRGAQHHRWYRATFKDYPVGRKAVIPFVW